MRNSRQLNRAEITEIIASYSLGETQADIARRYNVDHSTINYHIQKYRRAYPEEGGVYALIKVQQRKVCVHPSGVCTICGEMWDELRRAEREAIKDLQKRLDDAHSRLRIAGLAVE